MANGELIPCPGEKLPERNRYFPGKLMTPADFTVDQDYHRARQRVHNRLLHGHGTVCGLTVEPIQPASAVVVVRPGVAIDCCGREIQVVEPVTIDPRALLGDRRAPGRVYLTVAYDEVEVDPVPAPTGDGGSGDTGEAGRVREVARIGVSIDRPGDQSEIDAAAAPHQCLPCWDPRVTLAVIDLAVAGPIAETQIDNTVRCVVGVHGGTRAAPGRVEHLQRRVLHLQLALGAAGSVALVRWCAGRLRRR